MRRGSALIYERYSSVLGLPNGACVKPLPLLASSPKRGQLRLQLACQRTLSTPEDRLKRTRAEAELLASGPAHIDAVTELLSLDQMTGQPRSLLVASQWRRLLEQVGLIASSVPPRCLLIDCHRIELTSVA